MNYSLGIYKGKSAIFCNTSRCFVLFGAKKDLEKRVTSLNKTDEHNRK
jgi:hypothetical protein